MPKRTRKKTVGKSRIYNPRTKTYYSIRKRSTKKGQKGTIQGKWKPKS